MPGPVFHLGLAGRGIRALARTGLLTPVRPDRLARMVMASARLGTGAATGAAVSAAREPDHLAIVDELGTLTYAELDARAAALAGGLREDFGVGPERSLAIMCRNHRGFVHALLAASRCGADLLLLNTDFSGRQLAEVLDRERPGAVVQDDEYSEAFEEAGFGGRRVVAWHDGESEAPTVEGLIEDHRGAKASTRRQGQVVILTSGTTGTPKGARRSPSVTALVGPFVALASQLPLRAREPMLVGPPFFHGFGLAYLALGLSLGSTLVMRRRFDADAALDAIEEHGVTIVVGVPVMLQRILDRYAAGGRRHDISSLRALVSAAAPLSPALADALLATFGEVVYNLYGSTETGFGAIATPADLRDDPATVGRVPYGTTLRILDDDGRERPPGETGHIYMGGELVFEGYSGGGTKDTVDGLMNTGDLGHLDERGRLFIDGREDDMIVSGGENVFPQEVEDVLARHDGVADVAVVGVDDEEFGQRLKAFVVRMDGADLSAEALKGHVKEHLARYKVPREVEFLDELPRNPTGKLLRSKLS